MFIHPCVWFMRDAGMICIMLGYYAHHLPISSHFFSLILLGMYFACVCAICMLYAHESLKRAPDTVELEVRVF